jgi:hypothetical protein
MKLFATLIPLAMIGCVTTEPSVICKDTILVDCVEPPWYMPWAEEECEPRIDALTNEPAKCYEDIAQTPGGICETTALACLGGPCNVTTCRRWICTAEGCKLVVQKYRSY